LWSSLTTTTGPWDRGDDTAWEDHGLCSSNFRSANQPINQQAESAVGGTLALLPHPLSSAELEFARRWENEMELVINSRRRIDMDLIWDPYAGARMQTLLCTLSSFSLPPSRLHWTRPRSCAFCYCTGALVQQRGRRCWYRSLLRLCVSCPCAGTHVCLPVVRWLDSLPLHSKIGRPFAMGCSGMCCRPSAGCGRSWMKRPTAPSKCG